MRKAMRMLVLGLTPFLLTTSTCPQATTAPGKEDDLYSMALDASIIEMQKSWGYIDNGGGSRVRTNYDQLVAKQWPEITAKLPTQFGTHHVEYLDDGALINKYKTLGKEFSVLEIHPIQNAGPLLRVQVSVAWIKYKSGRLLFQLSDWSDVEFKYDCEKHAYIISNVKLGGI